MKSCTVPALSAVILRRASLNIVSLLAPLLLWMPLEAAAQIPIEFETHINSDLAGSVLSARLQELLINSKKAVPGHKLPSPRFRLVVRSIAIKELSPRVSAYEVIWLLDGKDGTFFGNSWSGYASDEKIKERASEIVQYVLQDIARTGAK